MNTPKGLPFVVSLLLCVGVAAQTTDIRDRVVDAALSLKFNLRGWGAPEERGAIKFLMETVGTSPVAQARCSGTVIFHGEGAKRRALILTAAHCVEGSRQIRTKVGDDGKEKKVVTYDDAQFSYSVLKKGRKVREVIGIAKVAACGEIEEKGGDDLALIEALDADIGKNSSAEILPTGKDYDIGTTVWNCSTLWGEFTGSLLNGIVSSRGFIHENQPFDTTNLSVRPGSSGSGYQVVVDGRPYLAGVITRWDGAGAFGMAVPIERIRPWLHSVGYARLAGDEPAAGEKDLLK